MYCLVLRRRKSSRDLGSHGGAILFDKNYLKEDSGREKTISVEVKGSHDENTPSKKG